AWGEAQLARTQAEREEAQRNRVGPQESYRLADLPAPRYADSAPDVLGNIHRIMDSASQHLRRSNVQSPGPSFDTSQSLERASQNLDRVLQQITRDQDRMLQQKMLLWQR